MWVSSLRPRGYCGGPRAVWLLSLLCVWYSGKKQSRSWKTQTFPAVLPSSREEVVHLARVLEALLDERPAAVKALDSGRVDAVLGCGGKSPTGSVTTQAPGCALVAGAAVPLLQGRIGNE
jgi:hypothetical protein